VTSDRELRERPAEAQSGSSAAARCPRTRRARLIRQPGRRIGVDRVARLGVEERSRDVSTTKLDWLALAGSTGMADSRDPEMALAPRLRLAVSTASLPTAARTSSPRTGGPPTPKWTYTSEPRSSRMSTTAVRRRSPGASDAIAASSMCSGLTPRIMRLPTNGARAAESSSVSLLSPKAATSEPFDRRGRRYEIHRRRAENSATNRFPGSRYSSAAGPTAAALVAHDASVPSSSPRMWVT